MKIVNVETKENSTVEMTIQVEAEVFEAAVQKTYQKMRGRINVPGFRKGKAPRKIIEKMYGAEIFHEDAINACYPSAYAEAVKAQGLDEVGYPRMEIVEAGAEGFTFKALVSVNPEVKIGNYRGLSAPKGDITVTDGDVDGKLQTYVARATRIQSVDRPVQDGDTTVIDFEGFDNGVAFDGGKGENFDLVIGSGSFVPGFEEQLIGMKVGEEKDIDITFPENYAADLAGKPVVFHVKINEVKEPQAPVLDDEFAKDVSEFETLSEFKTDLRKQLEDSRKEQVEQAFENAVIEQLVENMEVEVPATMVELQVDKLFEDYSRRLSSQGISMEDYSKMMGGDLSALRKSLEGTALHQVKSQLALAAVADAENFVVTDEEAEAEVQQLSKDYGISEEQVRAAVNDTTLRSDMRLKRAADLVISEAKVGPAPEKPEAKAEEAEEKEEEKAAKKESKTAKKESNTEEKEEKKETKTAAKKTTKAAKAEDTDSAEEKPAPKKRAPAKKKTEEGEAAPKKRAPAKKKTEDE